MAEEYLDRLAALEPFSPQELVAWLGIPLDEFPAWACAHLESELASINELARTFRDNEEPAALVLQIDDRVAKLNRPNHRSGDAAGHSDLTPTGGIPLLKPGPLLRRFPRKNVVFLQSRKRF